MKRTIALGLACIVTAGVLPAGVQDFPVTSATLQDWQLTGADQFDLSVGSALSLPAGTELARTFSAGAVVVYTNSRPVFSAASSNWPVLQVGPAALAFVRQGNEGRLVLLVDGALTTLSLAIPLDASSRSTEQLEIALGYDPSAKVGVVGFGSQSLAFRSVAQNIPVVVMVAAGASHAWSQDALEVMVITSDTSPEPASGAGGADAAKQAALLKKTADQLQQAGGAINGKGSGPATGGVPQAGAKGSPGLEIFTPPAVRRSAQQVRATVAGTKHS